MKIVDLVMVLEQFRGFLVGDRWGIGGGSFGGGLGMVFEWFWM